MGCIKGDSGRSIPQLKSSFATGQFHPYPSVPLNTLRSGQNNHHFAVDIFKCNFLNENIWVSVQISTTFVPKGQIKSIPALVRIMAWRRPGDKPLSEPMMVNLPTHLCVTRPQWGNWHWGCFATLGDPPKRFSWGCKFMDGVPIKANVKCCLVVNN